jgi:hypothetical protein
LRVNALALEVVGYLWKCGGGGRGLGAVEGHFEHQHCEDKRTARVRNDMIKDIFDLLFLAPI